MLTVYGIETASCSSIYLCRFRVGTVLTVYGIETGNVIGCLGLVGVGTVLTVYGIETY